MANKIPTCLLMTGDKISFAPGEDASKFTVVSVKPLPSDGAGFDSELTVRDESGNVATSKVDDFYNVWMD